MSVTLHLRHGDCLVRLQELGEGSVGAVVCDPPYELSFMGKGWDGTGIAYDPALWAHLYRVLVPGGVIKAFSATRTFHRMAAAMQGAGFTKIGVQAWTYGSGFPKSMNIGKQIDKVNGQVDRLTRFTAWMRSTGLKAKDIDKALKQAGLISQTSTFAVHFFNDGQPAIPTKEMWVVVRPLLTEVPPWVDEIIERIEARRDVVGYFRSGLGGTVAAGERDPEYIQEHRDKIVPVTTPATPAARTWEGWGTALKPSWEPVLVGRKPE